MGKTISFKRPDGKSASGYLAEPPKAKGPGIVVIQEWWGVQGQIKGVCEKLAAAGYRALAPDLYEGVVAPYHDTAAAERAMNALDFSSATDQTVRGAAQELKRACKKVGLTGYCLGGVVTALGAIRVPELDAASCYYGLPTPEAGQPRDVRVPFQGHFANQDDWCTPAAVDAFEAGLKTAGRTAEIYRYDAAHGFTNGDRPYYDAKADAQSWDRTLAFWAKHLG
jgi:carboxymethylenebutenolidase